MAYCVKCGTALPDRARFCGVCGTSLNDPAFDPYRSSPDLAYEGPVKTNGFAIAALVLGILGFCSPLAIIFGAIATGRIKRAAGREKGRGLAIAGIVLGSLWLVAGLLGLIAIPTYIAAHIREQDRVAQASLRNTLTSAKVIFTAHSDYREATRSALAASEPGIEFVEPTADSTSPDVVSSGSAGASTFFAAARSPSGTCWYVRDSVTPGPTLGTQWNSSRFLPGCRASIVPQSGWSASP
jgi:hypothetical protein